MKEHMRDFQERLLRETVRCLVPPSVFLVLQGDDRRFYPVRYINAGGSSLIEPITFDGSVVSFEHYADAMSFCRALSARLISFY